MDILPAHVAILISVEKYMVLAYQDYQQEVSSKNSEPALNFLTAKQLGAACLMFAALERLLNDHPETEQADVLDVLPHLLEIPFITESDFEPIKQTFWTMSDYKIIREEASVFEFVAERAWWAAFDNYDYSPDSALAGYVERLFQGYDSWCRFEMMCIEEDD